MGERIPLRSLGIALVAPPSVPVPPPRYGGTELVLAELVDGLVERGADVTLFACGGSTGGFRHRCRVRTLFNQPVWPPDPAAELEHAARAISEILRERHRFDLVHAHLPAFLPLSRALGIPVVYTLHHSDDGMRALYRRHPEISFVGISHRQLELLGPFARGRVLHHGLDPARFHLSQLPDHAGLAFLGRLSRVKGPHLAIDVARAAGLTIDVAGRPHYPEDSAFFRDELEWRLGSRHVRYCGEIGPEPKARLLSRARALLFPIDWEEPFGLVMAEAMLSGCPVMAFGRGSVPELIEEGRTGFIARDEAHMVELLAGPAHPARFDRAACREAAVRRFSAARMVEDYLDVYRQALAADRGAVRQPEQGGTRA